MNMKKTVCLIMSVLLLTLPLLSGCGSSSSNSDPNVVATVGSFEITQDDMEFYLTELSGSYQDDELLEQALDSAYTYTMLLVKAKELGIYDDDERDAFVDEQIEQYGGIDSLTAYGYSEEAIRNYLACMGAYYAIAKSNCSKEDAVAIFNDEYMTVKHILFMFEDDGEGDDDTKTLAKANSAYDRAVAGENFEDLINELNEDSGEDVESGYTFTEGTMVEEFYNASKELEIGEISKPVKTNYGYHVIKRYPLPEEGSETYDTYIENVQLEKGAADMEDDIEALKEKYPLKRNETAIAAIDLTKYASNDNYVDASAFDETN
jgi:hypothetical protein